MANHSESIEALNDLIQINRDRVEGYQRAIDEMKRDDKPQSSGVFQRYMQDSSTYIQELSQFVRQMGGTPADSATLGGKLHRAWMDIKNTFSGDKKESALESCIFGDSAAIKAYESALSDTTNGFSSAVHDTLQRQLAAIKSAHTANEMHEKALEHKNYTT